MDHPSSRDMGFGVDLESGLSLTSDEASNPSPVEGVKTVAVPAEKTPPGKEEKEKEKEKRKKPSNKKPPKPPRGPSLDAADQKLIREISELAMLKRARVERMKALKKMKAAKASSASSNSSLLAMVFTVLFCLVILFHGMSCKSPAESFQGSSSATTGSDEGGLISVQYYPIPSAVIPNGPGSESPNMVEQVSGSDPKEKVTRYTG